MARKRSNRVGRLFDLLDAITDLGFKLGGLVFLIVLGYIIYGIVAKDGFGALGSLPKADQIRLLGVVRHVCKALWISGAIFVFSVAVRYYVEETLGYILSGLGIVLYLGFPYMFAARFSGPDFSGNQAFALIIGAVRGLGMTVFIPSIGLIVRDMVLRVATAATGHKRKKQRDGAFLVGEAAIGLEPEPYKPRPYSQCWQTPYCRDFIRRACPVVDTNRSCWRQKRGCMCDGDIIMNALKSQGGESRLFQNELQHRGSQMAGASKLTARQKRIRCRTCIIYDFHQNQKYKLLSPLMFPAVVVTLWATYPIIEALVRRAVESTDKVMKIVSFLPESELSRQTAATATPDFVLTVFVIWLGVIAVSYALRLVEFCIFTLQI